MAQPFGFALPNQALDGTAIIGELAVKLGGKAFHLHLPLHIGNEQTRNTLLNDRQIRQVIQLAAKSDFIIIRHTSVSAAIRKRLRPIPWL